MDTRLLSLNQDELAYEQSDNLETMQFLNEVIEQFPKAISFASGRPSETGFDLQNWLSRIDDFVEYAANERNVDQSQIYRSLSQYGKTSGIVNQIICDVLRNDEQMQVTEEQLIVTNGAQEAMLLCLMTLFDRSQDLLVLTDPTYNGMSALAEILGIESVVVDSDEEGPDLTSLENLISKANTQGKTIKGLYVIPDFSNPLGDSISLQRRQELLRFSQIHKILIIEDSPYRYFRYEGQDIPSLKALDNSANVIQMGTFAKTVCPGLRIGYLIADQQFVLNDKPASLMEEFVKVKSYTSVNTSQVAQAMLGGILLDAKLSLRDMVVPLVKEYKQKLSTLLIALQNHFAQADNPLLRDIHWQTPEGGFFLTLNLPVPFGKQEAMDCARDFGVICVPVSFFSSTEKYQNCLRLSFSYTKLEQIDTGIAALANYLSQLIDRTRHDHQS